MSRMLLIAQTRFDLVLSNAIKQTPGGTVVGSIDDARASEVSDGAEAFTRLLEGRETGPPLESFRRAAIPPRHSPARERILTSAA